VKYIFAAGDSLITFLFQIQAAYSTARSVRRRILKTLDPSRLRKSDFMDLSSRQLLKLTVIPRKAGTPIDKRPFVTFYHKQRLGIPFPSGTHGFLYYHTPPSHAPATAGELRFRVTRGSNSTSFSSGIDLLLPNGLPWCISLLRIAQGANTKNEGFCQYQFIRRILVDDGLVTPALLKMCAEMVDRAECPVRVSSIIIHSLGQLFPVNFHTDSMSFVALHNDGCQGIKFQKLFLEQSKGRRAIPYHGKWIPSFWPSPRLDFIYHTAHARHRTLLLRTVASTFTCRIAHNRNANSSNNLTCSMLDIWLRQLLTAANRGRTCHEQRYQGEPGTLVNQRRPARV
jgi:hypothetical protein